MDFNATKAAIRTGYSKRSARKQDSWMNTNADIRKIIEDRKKQLVERSTLPI